MRNRVYLYTADENGENAVLLAQWTLGIPMTWCLLFTRANLSIDTDLYADLPPEKLGETRVELKCSRRQARLHLKEKAGLAQALGIHSDTLSALDSILAALPGDYIRADLSEFAALFSDEIELCYRLTELIDFEVVESHSPARTSAREVARIYATLGRPVPETVARLIPKGQAPRTTTFPGHALLARWFARRFSLPRRNASEA